jgi:xylan 1,4-beta-xylosidase
LTANESGQKCLQIISYNNLEQTEALATSVILDETKFVFLKASLNGADLQFYFASKENDWHEIGPVLDAGILSDDYVRDGGTRYCPAFTGAFVGLCCQDLSGGRIPAYFDWFSYQEYNYDFSELIKKEQV